MFDWGVLKSFGPLALALGLMASQGVSTLAYAADLTLAPCGREGLRSCAEVISETQALVRQRVQAQVNGYYGLSPTEPGKSVDLTSGILPSGDLYRASRTFGSPVCSLVASPLTANKSETRVDHTPIGKSCGTPIGIDVRREGRRIYTKITKNDPAGPNGSLESGYIRGALMPGISCFLQKVENELSTSKGVGTGAILGSASACAAFAKDYQSAVERLLAAPNINDIKNCKNSWDPANQDRGELRQSSPQLCGARASLEAAFAQIAACEVFARASAHYKNRIGGVERQRGLYRTLFSDVFGACQKECKDKVSSRPSDSELTACARGCYEREMPEFFADVFKDAWGSPTSGCSAGGRYLAATSGSATQSADESLKAAAERLDQALKQSSTQCTIAADCTVAGVGSVCKDGSSYDRYVVYSTYSSQSQPSNAQIIAIESAIDDVNLLAPVADAIGKRPPPCDSREVPLASCKKSAPNSPVGACVLNTSSGGGS